MDRRTHSRVEGGVLVCTHLWVIQAHPLAQPSLRGTIKRFALSSRKALASPPNDGGAPAGVPTVSTPMQMHSIPAHRGGLHAMGASRLLRLRVSGCWLPIRGLSAADSASHRRRACRAADWAGRQAAARAAQQPRCHIALLSRSWLRRRS